VQLNVLYLQLKPHHHQLDSEASKFFDVLLPALLELLAEHSDCKVAIDFGGFALEKLKLRKRSAWLEKLGKLSESQVELLSKPFYDLASTFITPTRLIKQLEYQALFWQQFGLTPSNTLGLVNQFKFEPSVLSVLKERGIKAIVADSSIVKNRSALARFSEDLIVAPTAVLNLVDDRQIRDKSSLFQMSQRVQLRSIALCPKIFNESIARALVSYLKSIFQAQAQGFLLPAEFVFPESATEELVLNEVEPTQSKPNPAKPNLTVELAWLRCQEAPSVVETRAEQAIKENRRGDRHGAEDKYESALRFIHQSSSSELDLVNNALAERSTTELALCGIVELEAYLKPDVDPTLGWINNQGYEHFDLVNTQLSDYILDKQGLLTTLNYKPRKAALVNTSLPPSFDLSFSVNSTTDLADKLKTALTRKTKDLCLIRYESSRMADFGTFSTFREITFRAGVGAHLPNATTGFSLEYWLEGELPDDLFATITFSFCLPAPGVESGFIRPLLCVGGVSEKRYYLEKEKHVDLSELTGGAYGVRIIDSVQDLTIDLRSAKQVEDMVISPVYSTNNQTPYYLGSTVALRVRAERINGDDKSNTLFFSIL